MAMVPFVAGAARGAGLFGLAASLFRMGFGKMGTIGGAIAVADVLNLDFFRTSAIKVAPGSDPSALEDAARLAFRMLGLSNDQVLWGRQRNGNPIPANYFTVDLNKGRAWISSKYYSRNSVASARRPRLARPRGVARYR